MSLHRRYEPAHGCCGFPRLGAKNLMAWFLGVYSGQGGRNLGIYVCKNIAGSSVVSVHADGRADDFGCPAGAAWAQKLADSLVGNSAELGIQCVIYNGHIWSGAYPDSGWRTYRGKDKHTTHIHVELSTEAASSLTVDRCVSILGKGSNEPEDGWTDTIVNNLPTLRMDDSGTAVRILQGLLVAHGHKITVDGSFGAKTRTAVRSFQRSKSVTGGVDGVVGRHTWSALLTA